MAAKNIEFADPEELKSWLEQNPSSWAHAIATRAALRVLPLVGAPRESAFHLPSARVKKLRLVTFRAVFVSWTVGYYPAVLSGSFAAAANAAFAAAAAADADAAFAAVNAAAAAANAAAAAANAAAAARSIEAEPQIWQSIADDAAWLERYSESDDAALQARDLLAQPLWLSDVSGDAKYRVSLPPWAREPFDHFARSTTVKDGGWKPWIDWYRALLPDVRNGRPRSAFGENIDIALATVPNQFWDRDPDEVMADIGRLARGELPLHPVTSERLQPDKAESASELEEHAAPPARETHAEFLADAHDPTVDHLDRARLAFLLAGRLNQVWNAMNPPPTDDERGWFRNRFADLCAGQGKQAWQALKSLPWNDGGRLFEELFAKQHRWDDPLRPGFVVHIDAPWGGGKTSFAGLLTRILNPYRHAGELPDWLAALPLDDERFWPEANRRPWHMVGFNAWRHQHVQPPWWVFAQAIRRQCLDAVLHETSQQAALSSIVPKDAYVWWPKRVFRWMRHLGGEMLWRLLTPSMVAPAVMCLLVVVALFSLHQKGILAFGDGKAGAAEGIGPAASLFVTLLLGGAPTVWALFNLFARTLFPGTPDAAANYALGAGDPLDRFRTHFGRTMRRLGRPIVVVVDDLDRCEPGYVVELIRGMQTILVSPRVVFVLLGDRDWIETAFTEAHKAMQGIDVGPEHAFGGRFVEKAIQFSFVLPDLTEETRLGYVRKLLKLEDPPLSEGRTAPSGDVHEDLARRSEAIVGIEDYAEREEAAAQLRESVEGAGLDDERKAAVLRGLDERLSLRAAADATAERATRHMIEGLAPVLPANPRQMKRIVNAISLMQEAARLEGLAQPGSPEWQVMARWVVLMIEWPKSWYTLSRYPALADLVLDEKAPDDALPTPDAEKLTKLIRENRTVMTLLTFSAPEQDWQPRPITSTEIDWLRRLMPATSGTCLG